jgi:hypothetical protein
MGTPVGGGLSFRSACYHTNSPFTVPCPHNNEVPFGRALSTFPLWAAFWDWGDEFGRKLVLMVRRYNPPSQTRGGLEK